MPYTTVSREKDGRAGIWYLFEKVTWTGRSIKFMRDVAILILFSSEWSWSVSRIRGVRKALSKAGVATSSWTSRCWNPSLRRRLSVVSRLQHGLVLLELSLIIVLFIRINMGEVGNADNEEWGWFRHFPPNSASGGGLGLAAFKSVVSDAFPYRTHWKSRSLLFQATRRFLRIICPSPSEQKTFCGFLRHLFFEHPNISHGQVSLLSSTSHITLLPSCLTIGRCPLCRLDKIFHHKTVVGARSVSSFVWSNIRSQSFNQYKVNGSGNAGWSWYRQRDRHVH